MKTSKHILCLTGLLLVGSLNAQVKVFTGGKTTIGSTSDPGLIGVNHWIVGTKTAFSVNTTSVTSTPLIMAQTANTASPGFTFYGDDQTGMSHPAANTLGFTITNSEKMRITGSGKIGIGTTAPNSLLSIGAAGSTDASAFIYNPSTTNPIGLWAETATPAASNDGISVLGELTCGTGNAYGVKGVSYNSTAQSNGLAIGVYGLAGNASSGNNWGVAGIMGGSNNGAGVYGADRFQGSVVTIPGNYAGYFVGMIRTTNNNAEKPTAGSWTGYSDIRLKQDTAAFTDGLTVLRQINPVTYRFNGLGGLSKEETHIGVIAQQVQQVAPYCIGKGKLIVNQSEAGKFEEVEALPADAKGEAKSIVTALTYNYDGLIYVLINSVKQLDAAVAKLGEKSNPDEYVKIQDRMNRLESLLSNADLKNNTTGATINQLFQNKPNPFNKETIIEYNVTQEGTASIIIFDMNGKLLKTIPVKIPGKGSVVISANDLSPGMYYYTLLVNDREVDTKKMILTE